MNQPLKLFRLQQVDSRINQINARLDEINAIFSNDKLLKAAEENIERTEKELYDSLHELRLAEEKTRAQRSRIV